MDPEHIEGIAYFVGEPAGSAKGLCWGKGHMAQQVSNKILALCWKTSQDLKNVLGFKNLIFQSS